MKKRIGVVADDVTGANDIGVMFKKGGFRSAVFPQSLISLCDIRRESEGLDVIIIDTDSRFDAPETAASKVAKATALLQTLPCDVYFRIRQHAGCAGSWMFHGYRRLSGKWADDGGRHTLCLWDEAGGFAVSHRSHPSHGLLFPSGYYAQTD